MRRAAHLVAALLLPALAAGCAPDSDPAADSLGRALAKQPTHAADAITRKPPVDGAPTVEFFAPVETEFEVDGPIEVPPGVVNISLTSEGNHNLALVGPGLPVALLWGNPAGEPEDGLTYSVELRNGMYTYYCSVPGHRAAGMRGVIRVIPSVSGPTSPSGSPTPSA